MKLFRLLISSLVSSYSLSTLYINSNSSWLIFKSIKALEIKTCMLFNLDFANNIISFCFSFSFLIIHLYFLIPAVIAQIFNLIAELVIPMRISSKEAKTEIEIHSVIAEAKIRM